ncbi:MAG TPA: ABC transporter permease [Candidatus Binataceae bacterium]
MNLFKLIGRNIRRNLRRTILTTITIALATFIFTILISVPASMDRIIQNASGTLRLVVNNRTAPWYDLPARYCNEIREMPGCVACASITGWPATYRNPRDVVMAFAVSPELGQVFPDYGLSRSDLLAMAKERRTAQVGTVLMKKEGWKIGDQIILHGADAYRKMDLQFVIMGTIPSKRYPNAFIFRRDYFNESLKAHGYGEADIAWNLFVRADSAEHVGALSKEIDDNFKNSDYETRTMTESDALAGGLSEIGNIRGIVYSLCAVVILTVMLVAANSMAMTVRERTSEVAVMRAIGFGPGQVANLLFGECALLGLIGGAPGAGLALWMFSDGVTLGAALGGNAALWVMPPAATAGFITAVIVSLLSGLIPIIATLRIPPALGFRFVA